MSLVDIRTQLRQGLDRPIWIVPDIISAGKIVCLAAENGTGKSMLALHLAIAVAAGAEFLGIFAHPGKVIYFDEEIAEDERLSYIRRLALGMGISEDGPWLDNLVVHDGAFRENPDGWELMYERALKEHHPNLVIIDTTSMAFPLKGENGENDNAQAMDIIKKLRRINKSTYAKVTVLLVSHGKLNSDGTNLTPRGASAWRNASDAWWKLLKSGDPLPDHLHEARLSHGKARAWSLRGLIRLRPFYVKDGRGIGAQKTDAFRFGPCREIHHYD